MIRRILLLLAALFLASQALAEEPEETVPVGPPPGAAQDDGPKAGDCAIFREGGGGRIFKLPTYWVKGTIAAVSVERRLAGRCPQIGKPQVSYRRDDWVRIAESTPCVMTDAEVREVEVTRIQLSIDEWETPWGYQHGTTGWLFRGYFLDKELKKGEIIDMDATWLERCERRP